MTHLEEELKQLKEASLEMTNLVAKQLSKAKIAFLSKDNDLADEIVHTEKRVNALELSINRDCENILALFSPVATDLRFVLAIFNVNSELERIGDYSKGIANYVLDIDEPIANDVLKEIEIENMFDVSIQMIESIKVALENEDSTLARKVFAQDKIINKIDAASPKIIETYIKKDPSITRSALYLFSTVKKLERVGDRAKNLAEDLIFYLEAEILKHNSKKV